MKLNTEYQNPDATLLKIVACMCDAWALLMTAIHIHRIGAEYVARLQGGQPATWDSLGHTQKQEFIAIAKWHLAEVRRAMAMPPTVVVVKRRAHDGQ